MRSGSSEQGSGPIKLIDDVTKMCTARKWIGTKNPEKVFTCTYLMSDPATIQLIKVKVSL